MIERPCDCPSCSARRLAWRIFLACFGVLALFGFLHRNDGRDRILIEASPSAFVDECGRVRPDLLDGVTIKSGKVRPKQGDIA